MSNDVEIVKQRIDIVDYVGNKVQLKSAGRNFKGVCPFHQEKSPSFMVNPDLQIYKCFGCGEAGDIYNFIQKFEGVDFIESLKIAADHIGYTLKNDYTKDDKTAKEKDRIYEANELTAKFWNYLLNTHKSGTEGRRYVEKRAIRKEEIDKFKMGFAPPGSNLLPFLVKKGFTPQELVKWGLATERKGNIIDKFRERFMLPIMDVRGRVVGFSGRIIKPSDYAPKYLNSPETLVYKKAEILMGLYQAKDAARKTKILILEEGNLDLMASHKVGVENIAATGGTAITKQQLKLVKRYADKVLFCFDKDDAGLKALLKAIEFAEDLGLEHGVIDLGDHKDPDELIQSGENWSKKVEDPLNSIEYLFKLYSQSLDMGSAGGKSKFAKLLVPILQTIKDKIQQQHFINQLAMQTGVTADIIQDQVDNKQTYSRAATANTDIPKQEEPELQISKREKSYLSLLTSIDTMPDEDSLEYFSHPAAVEVFTGILKHKQTGTDYSKISDNLGEKAAKLLQEVLMEEVTEDEEEKMRQLFLLEKKLYSDKLDRDLTELKMQMHEDPENLELLKKVDEIRLAKKNAQG